MSCWWQTSVVLALVFGIYGSSGFHISSVVLRRPSASTRNEASTTIGSGKLMKHVEVRLLAVLVGRMNCDASSTVSRRVCQWM